MAAVGLIFALGAALRFFRLGQDALWSDEVASVRTSGVPFSRISEAALQHNAFEPPLYFWLLHLVSLPMGDGEVSLRFLSAAAGALTIPLVWLLAMELTGGRTVAFLSAALLAINPLHLWYSQEARPYALLVCLCTAALWALARALRLRAWRWWAGFAVGAALAMLTHVAGGFVLAIAAVWVLIRRDWKAVGPFVLASLASLLLIVPSYAPLVQSVVSATGTGSPERPLTGLEVPYTVFTYLGGYSFGPSVRELQDTGWVAAARGHVVELGLAAVVLLLVFAQCVGATARKLDRTALLLLVALFALPAALTWLGSTVTGKAYNVRYTVLGAVGFAGMLSVVLTPLHRPMRVITAALVCLVFLWADAQWLFASPYRKDDARAAVDWLKGRLPPDATVAVAPGYVVGTLSHYARRSGTRLCFVSLSADDGLPTDPAPTALLLTRLHHAPAWRDLVRQFERLPGGPLERATVPGYQLLARQSGDSGTGATDVGGTGRRGCTGPSPRK